MRGKSPWAVRSAQKQNRENEPLGDFDWQALLHPANAYSHPSDVVRDTDLTLNEKRAILASWASDASAVVSRPALRQNPSLDRRVAIDEIMEALRSLDALALPSDRATEASGTNSPWRWPPEPDQGQHWRQGAAR